MFKLKTKEEIEIMARGGQVLATIIDKVASKITAGITTNDLDVYTRELVAEYGVRAAFLGYAAPGHSPFPGALCVSVNEEVVHGIPGNRQLKEGDLVGIDCGIEFEGLYLDHARTIPVGSVSGKKRHLLEVTAEGLSRGIQEAVPGHTIGDIGAAIQGHVESHGFSVVRQLVGHGVGHDIHEDPQVPNYGQAGKGMVLEEGLVIAIEPMVTIGDPLVDTAEDGWTIITASGQPSVHEEHTIAITAGGPKILTKLS